MTSFFKWLIFNYIIFRNLKAKAQPIIVKKQIKSIYLTKNFPISLKTLNFAENQSLRRNKPYPLARLF
jgi:hypothetical protein